MLIMMEAKHSASPVGHTVKLKLKHAETHMFMRFEIMDSIHTNTHPTVDYM